jgi:hypothetical protein
VATQVGFLFWPLGYQKFCWCQRRQYVLYKAQSNYITKMAETSYLNGDDPYRDSTMFLARPDSKPDDYGMLLLYQLK